MSELQRIKDELTEKNEQLRSTIGELQEDSSNKDAKIVGLEDDITDLKEKLAQVQYDLQTKMADCEMEVRLKEKMELEYRKARSDADVREKEVQQLNKQNADFAKLVNAADQLSHQKDESMEVIRNQMNEIANRLLGAQKENETNQKQLVKMAADLRQRNQLLTARDTELTRLNKEHSKLSTLKESLYAKIQQLQDQAAEAAHVNSIVKSSVTVLEKETAAGKKQATQDRKAIDELVRDKAIMNKNLMKSSSQFEKQADVIRAHEQAKQSLERDINNYKDEIESLKKIAAQFEIERDKLHSENGALKSKIASLMEGTKAQDILVLNCQKKIAEGEAKLKQQQVLYDTLKCERNLYSKNNVEIQDNVTDLNRKLKKSSHQLGQLEECLNTKEELLFREQQTRAKLLKQRTELRDELQQVNNNNDRLKAEVENGLLKERKLLQLIAGMECESQRQSQLIEKINVEKLSACTKLTQKCDEAGELQQQLVTLELSVARTERQNQALTEDVRMLKLEVKRVKGENEAVVRGVTLFEDLQSDICRLEKELMKEKLRSKALESELENPHNVHRWRRLVGSDPKTYELIQKVHLLQKRLIVKTEEVVNVKSGADRGKSAETLVPDIARDKISLKETPTGRASSSSVADKLLEFQQNIREKDKQIKSLISEQSVYLSELDDSKSTIQALKSELREAKYTLLILRRNQENNNRGSEGWTKNAPHIPQSSSSLSAFGPSQPESHRISKARSLNSGFHMKSASAVNLR